MDKRRNKRIRKELHIYNLNDEIIHFRNDWKNHILRINEENFKINQEIIIQRRKGM